MSQSRTPYDQTQLAKYGIANPDLAEKEDAPVEYITQVCESNGMVFHVSQVVLIPRIETEELAQTIVTDFKHDKKNNTPSSIRIIDIGTGSGFLGISVASMLGQVYADASIYLTLCDISADALEIAKKNAINLLPSAIKVEYFIGDVFDGLTSQQKSTPPIFDLILANLPYIPSHHLEYLDPSVRNYEPQLALDGGADGFRIISKLLNQVPDYLSNTSKVWLEVDPSHTVELCKQSQPRLSYTAHHDSFGRHRFIEAKILRS